MIKLPGLIDPHVHLREPGATHKEDWDTGTSAALAGGFTLVLAMPNTKPPIFDAETLELALNAARQKARCDYAQYLGAGPDNAEVAASLADKAAALKMYLDMTFGQLRLDDMTLWMSHFEKYPKRFPIVTHSESRSMAAAILFAAIYDRPVHIAHISLKEEILLIKAAKEKGIKVTCEVCPHHLFYGFTGSSRAERERREKGEWKSARGLPHKRMSMRSGRISMSSIALPPTMPRTPSRKRTRTIRRPVFLAWKLHYHCCSPRLTIDD